MIHTWNTEKALCMKRYVRCCRGGKYEKPTQANLIYQKGGEDGSPQSPTQQDFIIFKFG